MARVHVMGGYLNVEGMSGGYPDQGLPGDQPGIDNSLARHAAWASTTRCRLHRLVCGPRLCQRIQSCRVAAWQRSAPWHDLAQPWPSSAPDSAWRGTTYSHPSDSSRWLAAARLIRHYRRPVWTRTRRIQSRQARTGASCICRASAGTMLCSILAWSWTSLHRAPQPVPTPHK